MSGLLYEPLHDKNQQNDQCARRSRSALASAQSDQSPCYSHKEKFGPKQSIESTVNVRSVITCLYVFQKCKYFGNPLLQAN